MTDKEIIKALKEHYKTVEKGYTDYLAYGGKSDEHEEKYIDLLSGVLDLINRQQKQLDNYSHNVRNMIKDFNEQYKIIKQQQAENEGLRDEIEHLHEIIDDLYETITNED